MRARDARARTRLLPISATAPVTSSCTDVQVQQSEMERAANNSRRPTFRLDEQTFQMLGGSHGYLDLCPRRR